MENKDILELLHSNLCDLVKHLSNEGKMYIITFNDIIEKCVKDWIAKKKDYTIIIIKYACEIYDQIRGIIDGVKMSSTKIFSL